MVRFILLAAFFVVLALVAYVFSENPDWNAAFEVFGYRLKLHLGFVFFALLIAFTLFGFVLTLGLKNPENGQFKSEPGS